MRPKAHWKTPILGCFAVLSVTTFLSACKKDEKSVEPALAPAFLFCQDSCILNVPNVFTPDGDGINDKFFVSGKNFTLSELSVYDAYGTLVYTSADQYKAWTGVHSGLNPPPVVTGRYLYHLVATTSSGTLLDGYQEVQLLMDHDSPCFNDDVDPLFGDQFDPRLCGASYATNDLICLL
ncbi:MAG: gliding motility-associated C-terminal domain-containing protein [Flavobacteriales bacterium]